MFARVFGFAVLGLALAASSVGTAGDKDKDKKEKKETPKVELKAVSGTVARIDFEKGSFALQASDSKTVTYTVTDDTKFVGPKGGSRGMGKAGLRDETMTVGAGVRLMFGQDAKVPLEVYLPPRGATPTRVAPEPIQSPKTAPPAAGVPRIDGAVEIGSERVGPVRRVLRRIFKGY